MCVCVCVCVCACMHECMHACVRVCTYAGVVCEELVQYYDYIIIVFEDVDYMFPLIL